MPTDEALNGVINTRSAAIIPPFVLTTDETPLGRAPELFSHWMVGGGHAKPLHVRAVPVNSSGTEKRMAESPVKETPGVGKIVSMTGSSAGERSIRG